MNKLAEKHFQLAIQLDSDSVRFAIVCQNNRQGTEGGLGEQFRIPAPRGRYFLDSFRISRHARPRMMRSQG